jgi:hypothetical protein
MKDKLMTIILSAAVILLWIYGMLSPSKLSKYYIFWYTDLIILFLVVLWQQQHISELEHKGIDLIYHKK